MANDSYQLVVRNAPQSGLIPGQVIALEDDVLTLGRDPLSDIILDDPEVSRHHAKLLLQPGGYEIQDMGSTNGSFVDGKRLAGEPLALKPGQVIMLGSNVTLVYQAIPAVDPMATVVAPAAPATKPVEEVEEEPAVVEEVVEEVAEEEVELSAPAIVPSELEPEVSEELEHVTEDVEEEEEEFATMMDESPFMTPAGDAMLEPDPLPEIEPEPEPVFEEPVADLQPPPVPEPPVATFDELDERTYIDSAAPVSDFAESPSEASAMERPPMPPQPPLPKSSEPKPDGRNNRNVIIIAAVVILLICCCLAILAGVLYFVPLFSS